jgi:uncharacterized protein YjbI with pentapeptide repeats
LRFYKADLSGKDLRGVDLHDADLRESNLSNAYLSNGNLEGANLETANLSKADLKGCRLYFAYLVRANLSKADLRGSDLKGMIDFTGADLTGADMRAVDLDGMVNFGGAILHDVDFSGSVTESATISFKGADIQNVKGIQIPEPIIQIQAVGKINQYQESLRSLSEVIADKFRSYNIPAAKLKPIEESIKEVAKEVEQIKKPEDFSPKQKHNIEANLKNICIKILEYRLSNWETNELIKQLGDFSRSIGLGDTFLPAKKDEGHITEHTKQLEDTPNKGKYMGSIKPDTKTTPDKNTKIYSNVKINARELSEELVSHLQDQGYKVTSADDHQKNTYYIQANKTSKIRKIVGTRESVSITLRGVLPHLEINLSTGEFKKNLLSQVAISAPFSVATMGISTAAAVGTTYFVKKKFKDSLWTFIESKL